MSSEGRPVKGGCVLTLGKHGADRACWPNHLQGLTGWQHPEGKLHTTPQSVCWQTNHPSYCIFWPRKKSAWITSAGMVVPDSVVPDSVVPDSVVPDSVVPDSVVPDSMVPDSVVPDSVVPDSMVPDSVVPDSVVPDSAGPRFGRS